MRKIRLLEHYTVTDLKLMLEKQENIREYKEWLIIFSVANNKNAKAEEISTFIGIKKRKIYDTVSKYNKLGKDWRTIKKWGGRRDQNSFMTVEEEKKLFKDITEDALTGSILTYHDLKKLVEKKIKHEVSDDYIWVLFKRNNWVKNTPRPTHPEGDVEKRKEFKKNFKPYWHPKR